MLEALLAPMRGELDRLAREYTPDILLRAAFAKMADFVLYECLKAGPPPSFRERFNITDREAKTLYEAALHAAITRKLGAVDKSRLPEQETAHA